MIAHIKNYLVEKSDIIGISASFLCTIHCVITPIFFMAKPLMYASHAHHGHAHGHSHGHDHAWAALDYVFLIIAFVAVWLSTNHTHNNKIKIGLWVGWALLTAGILIEMSGKAIGSYIMYVGSFSLISLYLLNRKYCKIEGH
ncbi:MAG TPA: MerC domain-containing protein [Saprospiraceae bacterium]|nr:MerC domain-containing protein [Saprospiraceae bacterium]